MRRDARGAYHLFGGGVTHKNSIDIAIPFVFNTLQKWGNLVVTRYMRYIGHDSIRDDKVFTKIDLRNAYH